MYFVQDIMVNLTTMVKEALVNFYRTTGFKPHRSISIVSMHMRKIHIMRNLGGRIYVAEKCGKNVTFFFLSIYLPIYLSIYLFIYLSIYLTNSEYLTCMSQDTQEAGISSFSPAWRCRADRLQQLAGRWYGTVAYSNWLIEELSWVPKSLFDLKSRPS